MIHPKSFDNLINISKCPNLNKYVKRIEYEATTLDSLEEDEWRERLPQAESPPPMPEHPGYPLDPRSRRCFVRQMKIWDMNYGPGSQFSRKELEKGWEAYQKLVDATDLIQMDYGDFALLNRVFRNFPNLNSVEFNINQNPSETLKTAYAPTLIIPSPKDDIDRELASELGLRYLTPLLLALIYTNVKLTSFKAGAISWHAFHWPVNFYYHHPRPMGSPTVEFPWQIDPKELSPAFSHLRQFHVVFEPELVTDLNHLPTKSVVGQVLRSASCLEDVHLEFKELYYTSSFPPDQVFLDNLLGDIHWPHLKSLDLSSIKVTEEYLVQLLKRHSKTLKTLKLNSIYLSSGQWASAFQRMRADLRLTDVAFTEVFTNLDDLDDDSNAPEEDEEDEDVDDYLDMSEPMYLDLRSIRTLGERLETYFLEDGYRCPLDTREQKAWLRSEREKEKTRGGRWDVLWRTKLYKDGLKTC